MVPERVSGQGLTPLLLDFGSPREQLWGVLAEQPKGGAAFAFSVADQLALHPDRVSFPYLAGTGISLAPVLKYDRNVNNGFNGDRIYIAGIPFEVDEETKAVAATTVGAALSGGISFGVSRGTTLTFTGRSEYQRAIGETFEVTTDTAAVSLGYTSQSWNYLDAAYLVNNEKRELSTEKIKIGSLTVGRLFGTAGEDLHDLSLTAMRAWDQDVWQSRARIGWTGTLSRVGVFRLGLEKGEKIDGRLVPLTTIIGSYSNTLFGAPTTLSAVYSHKSGGRFFGEDRRDEIFRVAIERRVTRRVTLFTSYETTKSSIDSFDEDGFDIGITITGFRLH